MYICILYSTDYYQRLTLQSWFSNLEQSPLNRSQKLPAPYKQLIDEIKQNYLRENDWRTDNLTNNSQLLTVNNCEITLAEMKQAAKEIKKFKSIQIAVSHLAITNTFCLLRMIVQVVLHLQSFSITNKCKSLTHPPAIVVQLFYQCEQCEIHICHIGPPLNRADGGCRHIAAALFDLEVNVRFNDLQSCTSGQCMWKKRGKRNEGRLPIQDLQTSGSYGVTLKDPIHLRDFNP
ncbi:unnamed protein product, partial [Porites lobata]